MIRLFVPGDLAAGAAFAPSPEQAHYLTAVMRRGQNAEIAVFNGRHGEWRARLVEVSRRGCRLEPTTRLRAQPPVGELELLIALVKRARLETIVEKAVELGVARIGLLTTHRTHADHVRLPRLQAIAIEAAEQTGRLDVPSVEGPEALERRLDPWPEGRRLMFCDEAGDDPQAEWGGETGRARPVLEALSSTGSGPWSLLIGPEGGFDPAERQRLRALPWVTPVTLGPRILRADTAAVAALALWQAALGDWRAGEPPTTLMAGDALERP
jgi:16S rRNA (uracil1498-N3)-methyltransferase